MTEKPELSDGHGRIANEIMEVLSRTYMSSYESQFIWFLFRKTYGWNKKEDQISLSQIATATGMHLSHVSRTKKKLLHRRIVTQTGNKISFNKYHSQWLKLPKQVTRATPPAHSGKQTPPKQVITPPPKQAGTKERLKDNLQKTELKKINFTDADVLMWEKQFIELAKNQQWDTTSDYAEKIWNQHKELRPKNRVEFYRKVRVLLNSAKHPRTIRLARKVYYELAGLVNDRGEMEKMIDAKEIARRDQIPDGEIV